MIIFDGKARTMQKLILKRRRDRRRAVIVGGLLLVASVIAAASWWWFTDGIGSGRLASADAQRRAAAVANATPPAPPPQIYKPLAPDDAIAENATLPFSTAPIERALPLVVPLSASAFVGRRSAIDCLTAAIYYEAAQETETGKRGVAQVILNRARHPAFPNSICGVVYQGSERKTGCQFTFTCDGSLARKPSRAGWEAARRVALAALSGYVEPSVGMATHYHADYVVPYWASSLAKSAQVDHHIFYRWSGSWGRRAAFAQSVSQEQLLADQPQIAGMTDLGMNPVEPLPYSDVTLPASRILADEGRGALSRGEATSLSGPAVTPSIRADETAEKPAADMAKGALKVD